MFNSTVDREVTRSLTALPVDWTSLALSTTLSKWCTRRHKPSCSIIQSAEISPPPFFPSSSLCSAVSPLPRSKTQKQVACLDTNASQGPRGMQKTRYVYIELSPNRAPRLVVGLLDRPESLFSCRRVTTRIKCRSPNRPVSRKPCFGGRCRESMLLSSNRTRSFGFSVLSPRSLHLLRVPVNQLATACLRRVPWRG